MSAAGWIMLSVILLANLICPNTILNWAGYRVGLTIGRAMRALQQELTGEAAAMRRCPAWAGCGHDHEPRRRSTIHPDGTTERRMQYGAPASASPLTGMPGDQPRVTASRGMHMDHRMIPTDLKQPAMDAGYSPDPPVPGTTACSPSMRYPVHVDNRAEPIRYL